MTLATAITAFGANMIGGLLPDIDDETSDIWDKIRGGSVIGKIIHPLLGHHRMISHSVLGMMIIGFIINFILSAAGTVILVDMTVIWWAMMIGYISHLVMDSLTPEGVPWLFPIPIRMGFPPIKALRIRTGKLGEKLLVFPALVIINGYLVYAHYPVFRAFLKNILG